MSKKAKKIGYICMCCSGGILIGLFANKINTILGLILFVLGVFLLALSSIKIAKL